MNGLIRSLEKIGCLAAIIAVSSCAPQRHFRLHSVAEGVIEMAQMGELAGSPAGGPFGPGTSGGNPDGAGHDEIIGTDPNGLLSRISFCINQSSIQLIDAQGAAISLDQATDVTASVSLVARKFELVVKGLLSDAKIAGASFSLEARCGPARTLSIVNQYGTFKSLDALTLRLSGQATTSEKVLTVTLDAGGLIDALAEVTNDDQIPSVIAAIGREKN